MTLKQSLLYTSWSATLVKGLWTSSSYVEQTLFKGQDLVQSLTLSNRALKLESMAVLEAQKVAKSGLTETELLVS